MPTKFSKRNLVSQFKNKQTHQFEHIAEDEYVKVNVYMTP